MQLHQYVAQVQDQLRSTASLGDEQTRRTAEALAAAVEPALRLAVLAALSTAADEITAALLDTVDAPNVSVRLDGDECVVEARSTTRADDIVAIAEDSDVSARISLRLSEALKSDIEKAARSAAMSVNTWLVRTASAAASRPVPKPAYRSTDNHRVSGWLNS